MALTDECEHGIENPIMCCAICRRRFKRVALKTHHRLPHGWVSMEAQYDSRCPGCSGHIDAGEDIFRVDEGSPFICQTCAVEEMP
jgi:hypothetical protein